VVEIRRVVEDDAAAGDAGDTGVEDPAESPVNEPVDQRAAPVPEGER
jgi:hypothetical protein